MLELNTKSQDILNKMQSRADMYNKRTDKYRTRTETIQSSIAYLQGQLTARGIESQVEVGFLSMRARKSTKHVFTLKIGSEGEALRPTIAFRDSLNGESATFIDFGIYRKICANGLHVATHEFGLERRNHVGDWTLDTGTLDTILERGLNALSLMDKYKAIAIPADNSLIQKRTSVLRLLQGQGLITESIANRASRMPFRSYDADGSLFGLLNAVQESLTTNKNRSKKITEATAKLNRQLVPAIEQAFVELELMAA